MIRKTRYRARQFVGAQSTGRAATGISGSPGEPEEKLGMSCSPGGWGTVDPGIDRCSRKRPARDLEKCGTYETLGDCDFGRWVVIRFPDFFMMNQESIETLGCDKVETLLYSSILSMILHPEPVPEQVDPEEELRRRLMERSQTLPFPDGCLVKRLDVVRDIKLPEPSSNPAPDTFEEFLKPGGPLLSSAAEYCGFVPSPQWFWDGDNAGRLAVITQSSENIWMRSKQPILSQIRRGNTYKAILLPAGFSDPHLRKVRPWRLKEIPL